MMINNHEVIESDFFKTDKKHGKFIKRISKYIRSLMDRGRISEASYYYDILYEMKRDNKETVVLGYGLAIRKFDYRAMQRFDNYLVSTKCDPKIIFLLRLDYYYITSNLNNFAGVACSLLKDYRLNVDELNSLVECTISLNAKKVIPSLYSYLKRMKLTPSEQLNSKCKSMMIESFVDTLRLVNK
ncbi:hypothetical protein [Pantoea agglomerans]